MNTANPSFFRSAIDAMDGYVPGEQPRDRRYVKLNTNENPYPPCPGVARVLTELVPADFARYPDPVASAFREAAARVCGVAPDWILAGNGSDDILTIATRCFVDQGGSLATPAPSYSLYPVLAAIQGAKTIEIPLNDDFSLPDDLLDRARKARLLFLARPNAPTGNCFAKAQIRQICEGFPGIVLIDEAYADFAADNCLDLPHEFANVIISRTLSKSYAMAGLRLGFAVARPELIDGMMKVKDSYNLNRICQALGIAALEDQDYLAEVSARIRRTRAELGRQLNQRGFAIVPSEANFLFVKPPIAAAEYFQQLKVNGVLVRYFPDSPRTREFVRITIGTDDESRELLRVTDQLL